MALRIFGTDPETQPKPRQKFADDVVGRFRSGHTVDGKPAALSEWRVTTGDPEVADAILDLLGGDEPQTWDAKGEDNLEVFTASKSIEIILDNPRAIRQRMVLWGRNGKPIYTTDGEFKLDDRGLPTTDADPDAALSFQERKQKGRDGTGPTPDVEVYFRLAETPDLGVFKFQSGSWSLVSDMAYNEIDDVLSDAFADSETGKVRATLALEEVSFVAKNGPQAGKTVTYTKPTIEVVGPVESE